MGYSTNKKPKEFFGPVELPDALLPAWFHPTSRAYLQTRGLNEDEARFYDLGYCVDGPWTGRLIIPIFHYTELVGFQGRLVSDTSGNRPRYKTHGRKAIYAPCFYPNPSTQSSSYGKPLVVVEGAFDLYSTMRVCPTIATLGINISGFQLAQITDLIGHYDFSRVVIWFDNEPLAQAEAWKLSMILNRSIPTEVLQFEDAKDCGEMTTEQIQEVLHGL